MAQAIAFPNVPSADSLRARFALGILVLGLSVWLAGGMITLWVTQHESVEVLDGQLTQAARFIAAMPTNEFEEFEHQLEFGQAGLPETRYEPRVVFQVWNRDGKLLFASPDAPTAAVPEPGDAGQTATLQFAGEAWRAHVEANSRYRHVVRVMARHRLFTSLAGDVAQYYGQTAVVILPLLLMLGALVLRRALAPIERLRGIVKNRAASDLTPFPTDRIPAELANLVSAFNGLMSRYAGALESIRRFSGNAAHELRTPLAAIRLNAQVALGESDPAWRDAPLREIVRSTADLSGLVDQLLMLARLDHTELDFHPEPCDLSSLVRDAASKQVVRLHLPEAPVIALAIPALIDIALRNLLDNAVKHGSGEVLIEVGRDGNVAWIAVEDDGAGIIADSAGQVFEPFFRAKTVSASGAGLGLSIVARIATVHGGSALSEIPVHLKGGRIKLILVPA